jgi:DNA polymerase III subunit gamma/tau
MSYVVLARKWRPMRFEDLVGQDHVARTLGNAIAQDRVAHAFLFTGVRGVGKTTSARILAKALNCTREPGSVPAGVDPGPTVTPCLKCSACLEITAGSDVDVREIDGASYNGVDEVRKLQDSLPYRPARDRYKIFIVDEVHMLSQNAWNAFLKTLEEPPPHVKFIFATTEVHKVPVTILSRVQRFDFKLISTQLIARRLREVLTAESINSDDQAIAIIAREAAGSMRDAMSLLDQVIAWGGDALRGEDVARVLGIASRQVLHDIAAALVGGDAARCLEIVGQLAGLGYDIAHVARDILAMLRDLVVAKVCKNPGELLDLADEEKRDVGQLSEQAELDDLLRLHQGFSQSFDDVVRSGQPRAALEMLLVRLARRPPLLPIDDLLGRLRALEQRLSGSTREKPRASGGRAEAPKSELAPTTTEGRETAKPESQPPASAGAPPPEPKAVQAEPKAVQAPAAPAPLLHVVAPIPQPAPEPARAQAPDAEPPPAAVLRDFRAIVDIVHESRPELAAFFEHAAPLEVSPEQIVLAWEPKSMFAARASDKEALAVLGRAAFAHFDKAPRITCEFDSERARSLPTLARLDSSARERKTREALQAARKHPRIADAVEILGAKLKDVKIAGS